MNNTFRTLSLGLLTALLFSAFIYFDVFHLTNKFINTLFGLGALGLFLYIPKRSVLVAGFFIGLFWFYWIGYSFEYQDVGYMTPIITLAFGVVYLLFFAPLYFTDKAYIRAIFLFILSFIEPFDWNWLQIELIFVESYIGVYKYQLFAVLSALSLVSLMPKSIKYAPLLLLVVSFNYGYPPQKDAPLKIKLVQTEIKQEDKWQRKTLYPTVEMIFQTIAQAVSEQYDVVIFPESVFAIFMNNNPSILKELLKASQKISIVAGSLIAENHQHYNVTYLFENGKYHIAKKLILVPFGEYIPLPKFARKFINDTFFSGASDFVTAKNPTDFMIQGVKFRNAICYEATCQEIYEGDVSFVIATSNNAWFAPSIEPVLQNLLLRYYARKNGVTVYHSANYKGTGVIK
jgi:apolipoprotein N-acyltransferase